MKRILALHFVLGLLTAPLPAYDVATHRAVALVACRDHPESKVATTLIRSLGYPAGLLAPASIGPENLTFLDWLVAGAEHEDSDLVFRYARHFYDPITRPASPTAASWDC